MTTNTITNVDVLRTVTVSQGTLDAFDANLKARTAGAVSLKRWPKNAGPLPQPEMWQVALVMGKQRKAGPEAGFVAMQLRGEGASVAELSAAFNSGPAHNHSRDLSSDTQGRGSHYFTRTKGNGRFYLVFTAKGVKALEKAMASVAAPADTGTADTAPKAKAKAKRKATSRPRKGKAEAPAEPITETPVETPVTSEAPAEHHATA